MQIHSKVRDLGKANGAIKKNDEIEAGKKTFFISSPWYQETSEGSQCQRCEEQEWRRDLS